MPGSRSSVCAQDQRAALCHVRDLGKTVRFTLPDGKIVHSSFRQHDCGRGDSRERRADEVTCVSEAAQGAKGGDKADA